MTLLLNSRWFCIRNIGTGEGELTFCTFFSTAVNFYLFCPFLFVYSHDKRNVFWCSNDNVAKKTIQTTPVFLFLLQCITCIKFRGGEIPQKVKQKNGKKLHKNHKQIRKGELCTSRFRIVWHVKAMFWNAREKYGFQSAVKLQ